MSKTKKPGPPLTKSAVLAEMERIQREVMRSLLEDPSRVKILSEELRELVEYVENNKDKIKDE